MRSSLSCEFCRRSKIKCVHTGNPPCQKCQKSDIPNCVLSRPRQKTLKNTGRRSYQSERPTSGPLPPNEHGANGSTQPSSSSPGRDRVTNAETHEDVESWGGFCTDEHLSSLSSGIIFKALNTFANKYPELGIIHIPQFMKEFRSLGSRETKTLLAAILAITRSRLLSLNSSWSETILSREQYASYAGETISHSVLGEPKIQVVQALLVMTLFEWGTREFHKSWMYCGMAIRIMQAIHSHRIAPYPLDFTTTNERSGISLAIENRTFWSCFIMDRMINSGTYNPPMLPMSEMKNMKISPPLSAVEFTFGPDVKSNRNGVEQILSNSGSRPSDLLDITQSFEILVSGFDIWAQVMTFVFKDGRRAPGMCSPNNCPWVPGSPWSRTRSHLECWRAGQHHRLHYPNNSVAAHMSLGCGESFVYSNLLYYICTLILHREYFPFMPLADSSPRGPLEIPVLEAQAPNGWWNESAAELFGAAKNISSLLHEASDCGADLMSPLVGFCAFNAAYMDLYIFRFPQMNLCRSPDAKLHLDYCLSYLEDFQHQWSIGESWIKTVKHASLLYERAAADKAWYQGSSRADLDILHQSIHEFRVVDRSDQQIREIEGAERSITSLTSSLSTPLSNSESDVSERNVTINDLLPEMVRHAQEQGTWAQGWPALGEVNLALFSG